MGKYWLTETNFYQIYVAFPFLTVTLEVITDICEPAKYVNLSQCPYYIYTCEETDIT